MEHTRKQKLFIVVALFIAIASLSVGFAAFSTTLNISSSANVTPNSDSFAVKFSTNQNSLVIGAVSPSDKTNGVTATGGIIDNSALPTLTNLSATFSSPGQYVEYTVYARNEGEYTAYLNNVNYIGNKTCIASTGTTESLVQSACDSINVKVTIGSTTYTKTTPITAHVLTKGSGEAIKVRLEYASNGTSVDGSFEITFPSIVLMYSTVDDSSLQPNVQSKVCTYVDSEDDTGSQIGIIDLSDIVTCGTESFYVMSNEGGTITMLSKYNLHVGNSVDEAGNVTPLMSPTGIQDSDAKGAYNSTYPYIGVTTFFSPSYDGSIVEGYVNSYKTHLENIGADVLGARLITIDEIGNLGCHIASSDCSNAPSWVYSTSYWSESPYTTDWGWVIHSSVGVDIGCYYDYNYNLGVRPVIEILESEIKKD